MSVKFPTTHLGEMLTIYSAIDGNTLIPLRLVVVKMMPWQIGFYTRPNRVMVWSLDLTTWPMIRPKTKSYVKVSMKCDETRYNDKTDILIRSMMMIIRLVIYGVRPSAVLFLFLFHPLHGKTTTTCPQGRGGSLHSSIQGRHCS